MSASEELFHLIAGVSNDGGRPWCDEARRILDEHRAEVLREAAAFVGNDDTCDCGGCDSCVPRALAAGLLALADGRKEKATGDAATATPDFFQKGRTYTRNLPYRAPELRPDFQCIGIGQHPTKDEPRAFGFYRDGSTSPWGSAALSTDRWADGWVEIVETEETR
jgi:hypothetical protein